MAGVGADEFVLGIDFVIAGAVAVAGDGEGVFVEDDGQAVMGLLGGDDSAAGLTLGLRGLDSASSSFFSISSSEAPEFQICEMGFNVGQAGFDGITIHAVGICHAFLELLSLGVPHGHRDIVSYRPHHANTAHCYRYADLVLFFLVFLLVQIIMELHSYQYFALNLNLRKICSHFCSHFFLNVKIRMTAKKGPRYI